jgi:hypothetical protein
MVHQVRLFNEAGSLLIVWRVQHLLAFGLAESYHVCGMIYG